MHRLIILISIPNSVQMLLHQCLELVSTLYTCKVASEVYCVGEAKRSDYSCSQLQIPGNEVKVALVVGKSCG